MALSRRQFFRRFWETTPSPSPKRIAQYEVLERYIRTQLLPYDFALTAEQERELIAEARAVMEKAPNSVLFSPVIRGEIEVMAQSMIEPWRRASIAAGRAERMNEIRRAAADYVSTFLTFQATPQTIDQLKERFGTDDLQRLEAQLRFHISDWMKAIDDDHLEKYDICSIQELVFAQLRSWC